MANTAGWPRNLDKGETAKGALVALAIGLVLVAGIWVGWLLGMALALAVLAAPFVILSAAAARWAYGHLASPAAQKAGAKQPQPEVRGLGFGQEYFAQEKERLRLARELDHTSQAMASVVSGIEALRDSLPSGQAPLRRQIERAIGEGRRALDDLHAVTPASGM